MNGHVRYDSISGLCYSVCTHFSQVFVPYGTLPLQETDQCFDTGTLVATKR
jgi:hypothetical protein